jgi:hypothetical protein
MCLCRGEFARRKARDINIDTSQVHVFSPVVKMQKSGADDCTSTEWARDFAEIRSDPGSMSSVESMHCYRTRRARVSSTFHLTPSETFVSPSISHCPCCRCCRSPKHIHLYTMARGIEGNEIATPRTAPKKTGGSTQKSGGKQQSIAGFFKRTPGPAPSSLATHAKAPSFNTALKEQESSTNSTPVPSSLPPPSSSPHPTLDSSQPESASNGRNKENSKSRIICVD